MRLFNLVVQSYLLLLVFTVTPAVQAASGAQKVNCLRSCGNISVPFPFGLEEGCSARKEFQLKCTNETSPSLQFDAGHQVTHIDIDEGIVGITYTPQQIFRVEAPKQSGMYIGSLASSSVQWVFANLTCQEAQQNSSAYGCIHHYSACLGVTSADGNIGYRCKCALGFEGNPYIPHGCLGQVLSLSLCFLYIIYTNHSGLTVIVLWKSLITRQQVSFSIRGFDPGKFML